MANHKKNNKNSSKQSETSTINTMGNYASRWITDSAWISGVAGALTTIILAASYNQKDVLSKGINLFHIQLTSTRHESILAALLMITFVMVFVETFRVQRYQPTGFFNLSPKIKAGRYLEFLVECLTNYVLYVGLLWLVFGFYKTAGEYGFSRKADYYQSWFLFIEWVWSAYLYCGLPYIILTRALKHNEIADSRDYAYFFQRLLGFPLTLSRMKVDEKYRLTDTDKKIARGLLVKLFFHPLMTAFFISQFPHLVNNIGYLSGSLWQAISSGQYTNARLNNGFV